MDTSLRGEKKEKKDKDKDKKKHHHHHTDKEKNKDKKKEKESTNESINLKINDSNKEGDGKVRPIKLSNYEMGDTLGTGSFGRVKIAKDKKNWRICSNENNEKNRNFKK